MAGERQSPRRRTFGAASLVGLEQGLSVEDIGAPYYCSYPSFQDIYRIIVRMGERQGAKGLLLLCTLRGQSGAARARQPGGCGAGPLEGQAVYQEEWPLGACAGGCGDGPPDDGPAVCREGSPEVRTAVCREEPPEARTAEDSRTEEGRRVAARKALEREMARLRRTMVS